MPASAVAALCGLLFATHTWLILGHRQRMGADPDDRPQDPLFSGAKMFLSFIYVLGVQGLAAYRRIALAYGAWQPTDVLSQAFDWLALPTGDLTLAVGVLLFAAGLALRLWAIRIMGRLFTFEIGIRPEHQVVEEGPYRLIRHPSYTGYALVLLGIGTAYASGLCLLLLLPNTLIFFTLRIRAEERMLLRHFGAKYEDYMKRTKRLIPFIL